MDGYEMKERMEMVSDTIADKDAQIASLTSEIHGLKVTIQQRWDGIREQEKEIASLTKALEDSKKPEIWNIGTDKTTIICPKEYHEMVAKIASLEDELMTKKVIIMSLNDLVSNSTTQVNRLEKEIALLKELVRDAMITLEYHGVASIYWLKRAKEFTQ